jgi:hypothetical protein
LCYFVVAIVFDALVLVLVLVLIRRQRQPGCEDDLGGDLCRERLLRPWETGLRVLSECGSLALYAVGMFPTASDLGQDARNGQTIELKASASPSREHYGRCSLLGIVMISCSQYETCMFYLVVCWVHRRLDRCARFLCRAFFVESGSLAWVVR